MSIQCRECKVNIHVKSKKRRNFGFNFKTCRRKNTFKLKIDKSV